jgi:hypothetical protein
MPKLLKNIKNKEFYEDKINEINTSIDNTSLALDNAIQNFKNKYIEKEHIDMIQIIFSDTHLDDFSLYIRFFDTTVFGILLNPDLELEYSVHQEDYLTNINSFEDFNKEYDIYKKYTRIFFKNKEKLAKLLSVSKELCTTTLSLVRKKEYNSELLFTAKNKNKLSKINKVFPLNNIDNIEEFIFNKYFKNDVIAKLLSISNDYKLKFLSYSFGKDKVFFKDNYITINGYNTDKEKYLFGREEVSKTQLKEIFENSFSYKGNLVKKIEILYSIPTTPTDFGHDCSISYDKLLKKINPDIIKMNVDNF